MKYCNFLAGKFSNILNNNNKNVKITFKTIDNKAKQFTNNNLTAHDSCDFVAFKKLMCSYSIFYIGKIIKNFLNLMQRTYFRN